MRRTELLATALGVVLFATPAFATCSGDLNEASGRSGVIVLAQGGSGADSGGTGGLTSATPGSPAAGNLGSTPQNMQGRSQQPAQGSATTLAPTQGRGAPDPSAVPGARSTAPGGTAVMPGDSTTRR